jgi:non-ribosomal peptide synthetase-like protein
MLTKEEIRSGPDLLPILREAEVTMLFCPPVLLTTLTQTPEQDLPYPLCRYIVPAGEAFPAALVEPWTRGRRQIINTYGPTEASTDTSRQSLRAGEPVTIGSPLANVTYVILEPGTMRPLKIGEIGELCIGGVHVGRGYRNLPEQTAEKFVSHPKFGRLYRTGDRCRIDPATGQAHFHGRIDTQFKVRGHRVEIQAVEDILQMQIPEIETAVLDYQNEELVAFIAAPGLEVPKFVEVAPAPAEWATGVGQVLARQLPEVSVPTRLFLVNSFVLNPRSGKIDRAQLPRLSMSTDRAGNIPARSAETVAELASEKMVEAAAEHGIYDDPDPESAEVLTICRELLGPSLGWDDAFADHGAHSILIAQLAQKLRVAGWSVPVRALLTNCNTARKISRLPKAVTMPTNESVTTERRGTSRDEVAARVLSVSVFTFGQILFLLILYAPHLISFIFAIAYTEIDEFFLTAQLWQFIVVGFSLYVVGLALPFANLLWALAVKRYLLGTVFRGRIASGVYPKWSRVHLRNWCLERLQGAVLGPIGVAFRSPPLLAFALRQLGAAVGRNTECAHEVSFSGPIELLEIEDDVTVQTGAYIQMSHWVGGDLHIGPIKLRHGCKIGMRACVANDVVVGRGSWVTPFTPVLGDVGPGEIWEGAPARLNGRCLKLNRTASHCRSVLPIWALEIFNLTQQSLLDFVLMVAPTATVTWLARGFFPVVGSETTGDYFMTTPLGEIAGNMSLYAFATTWVAIITSSLLACLFLRLTRASPGLYFSRGLRGALLLYRQRLMNQVQRLWTWTIIGQYLRALAGLRFSQWGGSECDIMYNLVPDAATADAKVFWANGCRTNMLDQSAGQLILRQLDMPANFFASNNCVVEEGHFATNLLLGVSSPGNGIALRRQMHSRFGPSITVAGNPPMRFASADFEAEKKNFAPPSFSVFLGRVLLNDIFSIGFLRSFEFLTFIVLYTFLLRQGGDVLLSVPLTLVLTAAVLVMTSIAVKHLVVGRTWGNDNAAPFWSWRHFTYFFAQDCFFAWCRKPFALSAGTLLANPVLRWMGCEIGERVILASPLQAYDWNAVSIGNDAFVDGLLQYHSLENMTLTVKRASIGAGVAVNAGATVMAGAKIEAGATLLPLSLVLKEMRLPAGVNHGSPAELVDRIDQSSTQPRLAHAKTL